MRRLRFVTIAILVVLAAGLYGQAPPPPPTISSISPSSAIAGSPTFGLIVTGTGFQSVVVGSQILSTSLVRWNGVTLSTIYLNPTQRLVNVDASLVANAGTATVDVVNPDAQASNPVVFTILAPLVIATPSPLPPATLGSFYSVSLVASGGTPPYGNWRVLDSVLPSGLTLNAATGVLSGTPTAAGTGSSFYVFVDDSGGQTASKTFSLTVNIPPLTITTTSLPNGTVGVAYSQTLAATGGTGSYTWSVSAGLPAGLTLSQAGLLSGVPTQAGSYPFTVTVTDRAQATAQMQFTLIVNRPAFSITTTSLAIGTVGVAYSQTLTATGGTGSYTWSVSAGLPAGLTLSQAGLLSGTPTQAGSYPFTITVTDTARVTAQTQFALIVNLPALSITTASLPNGTVGVAYSQTLAATGGTGSYTWSVSAGLPAGLTLSQAGLLSGTPTTAGTFTFTVTVNGSVSQQFTLIVTVPAAPVLSITDVPATPGQQPSFNVQLSSAYTLDISGTVTLTFAGDSGLPNDPNIVFQNGTRTLDFTIAAGSTVSPAALQTGTVAGRIDLTTTRLVAAGQSILPSPAPVRSIQIPRSAPKINSVQVVKTTGGFNVLVTGYSTPRQVTQAAFTFTASSQGNLQTTQVTVPVDSAFTTWYSGTSSGQYGSTFLYTQPFTVQGDMTAIASVSVTLTNAVGTSQSMSATF